MTVLVTLEFDSMKKLMIDDHHLVGESVHINAVSTTVTTIATATRRRRRTNQPMRTARFTGRSQPG